MPITSHSCCCSGGCNGWFVDSDCEVPSSGFDGADDHKCTCYRNDDCDGDGVLEQTSCGCPNNEAHPCCGAGTPNNVQLTTTTWWDWGWTRSKHGITCQGANAPTDPPSPSFDCSQETWKVYSPAGTTDSNGGWNWMQGGSINMTLEASNDIAQVSSQEIPPGCCATYYYGACDVSGPSANTFTNNPFGYGTTDFDSDTTYGPPPALRAYGRLSIQYAGEGPNIAGVQPRVTCLVRLQVFIGLRGYADHWIEAIDNGALPEAKRVGIMDWKTSSSVNVSGCNCSAIGNVEPDVGVHVLDKIDWSNLASDSYWNYAWPHPLSDGSGSVAAAAYPATYNAGGRPGFPNPCGASGSGGCVAETFSMTGFSCCTTTTCATCASTAGCEDHCKPHCHRTSHLDNFNRTRQGLHVWTTNGKFWSGASDFYSSVEPDASNRNTSWHCYYYTQSSPCVHNTNELRGGFVSAGPATFFPNCSVADVTITNLGSFL